MQSLPTRAVLSAITLLLSALYAAAEPVAEPVPQSTNLALKTMVNKGCYNSADGLTDQGSYIYQSSGYCQQTCVTKGYAVMALWKGSNCLCGNTLPPDSEKTDNSTCNSPCDGYSIETCGGSNAYNVYLTGTESNVSTLSNGQTSANPTATSSESSTGTLSVITKAGETIVVTASSQSDSQGGSSGSGPGTTGIAVGVVLGVIAAAVIAGVAFFLIRRHRRRSVEAAYRRNAAMNSYAPSKTMSASSVNNSRWDGDYMAQRRQSNGSIADDQDFSRRILKVTNPDR